MNPGKVMTHRDKIEMERRRAMRDMDSDDAAPVDARIDYKNKNFVAAQQAMHQCVMELNTKAELMKIDAKSALADYENCKAEADAALDERDDDAEFDAKLMEAAAHKKAYDSYIRMASQLRQFALQMDMNLKTSEVTRTTQKMADSMMKMLQTMNPSNVQASMQQFEMAFGASSQSATVAQDAMTRQSRRGAPSSFSELRQQALDRAAARKNERTMNDLMRMESVAAAGGGDDDSDMKQLQERFEKLKN